ncbi:hypothetical protein BO71DRAFT_121314 [Aspergillus ellipticus CBS 707.79]|uniref:Uncharacterized protein n=1 Tax=Aspergillus ellipticus CBS 707.79 TaxID=1448320 RepID=A0A319DJ71_9EURO|nr:hypothetical protein BO71DRAFT_121314 [Aspergillus ellipticus CBS 707.79]
MGLPDVRKSCFLKDTCRWEAVVWWSVGRKSRSSQTGAGQAGELGATQPWVGRGAESVMDVTDLTVGWTLSPSDSGFGSFGLGSLLLTRALDSGSLRWLVEIFLPLSGKYASMTMRRSRGRQSDVKDVVIRVASNLRLIQRIATSSPHCWPFWMVSILPLHLAYEHST